MGGVNRRGMRNEARVGTFVVAGQPTEDEVRGLAAAGYSTVVNVRMPDEPGQLDPAAIVAAGIDYATVPYTGATMAPEHVDAIKEAIAGAKGPVLIH